MEKGKKKEGGESLDKGAQRKRDVNRRKMHTYSEKRSKGKGRKRRETTQLFKVAQHPAIFDIRGHQLFWASGPKSLNTAHAGARCR